MTKHIVCYSGGHSSALVALHVAKTHGIDDLVLLNHDINDWVEDADIERFKNEVAQFIGLPITYATYMDAQFDQFDVCVKAQAFKVNNGNELCTNRLKTGPFMEFLEANHPEKDVVIYYGFDANEIDRVTRRSSYLGALGYRTAFPLVTEKVKVTKTEQIGIRRPNGYSHFKHGNCKGCLKAGWQHWYIIYCFHPDIWAKAKWAEEEIGYAIHHDETGPVYLEDMEQKFEAMKQAGVPATEHMSHQSFWARANKVVKITPQGNLFPCECVS